MKDIVIIANFCRDFSETDNGRFMYLCKALSIDNKVEIITSDYKHVAKTHKEPLKHNWPFTITFLHEPGYKKNISFERFWSHNKWGKEVSLYLKNREKPDVIYCAIPSLTAALGASSYCVHNNIKFIIDIQDLWPEAFQMVFNIPIIKDILFFPFRVIANSIYKRADVVCAVSQRYVDRALKVNKKNAESHVVYLGTDLNIFDYNVANKSPLIKKDNVDEIWIGYCGSLTASYDIPCVLKAIKLLNNKHLYSLRFIVMGDGSRREEFETEAKTNGIESFFLGKLPYDEMCAQLVQCDIVVNPIVKGSAASIINKHGDYASSGLPVLNTQESKEYRELIDLYKMGFNCENGNPDDLASKLETLICDKNTRKIMGANARKCAEERFDRSFSYKELINCIIK